ncbi:28168_t:CDS:1 [Gigaspora margarita]|uniref:28168_t:CDS:1 n=1 Tax=Gigaspora margarita TaxID=4874 RepID=A0ABN7UU77_GIGMA|nr:28168_t:CDS:1 [Gigaspora margarita]
MGDKKNVPIVIPFKNNSRNLYNYLRNRNYYEHEGILSAFNAIEAKLSPNCAYILLLGISGAGKSSTINSLFGNKNITVTGFGKSQTKDIIEFKDQINDSRLGIKNLEISIIDGPGLEDTKGIREDAKNILSYRRFLETHPQLSSVRPNIIMIVANITDTRLGNLENMETQFARMLKGIKDGLGDKILDHKRPSVIFVLTHLQSIPPGILNERASLQIELVKKMSENVLGIIDPPVVTVENEPENWGLQRDGGWYVLSNGEKHPLNLFNQLINLCKKLRDNIGQEAISMYFSKAATSTTVKVGHKFSANELNELNELNKEVLNALSAIKLGIDDSEVRKIIDNKFSSLSMEAKKDLGDGTPNKVASFLKTNKIDSVQQIPNGDEFLELFAGYPRNSANLLPFLKQTFQREATEVHIDPEVGKCYNLFKDSIVSFSVFQFGEYTVSSMGFKVPPEVHIININENFTRCELFKNENDYAHKRLSDLGLSMDSTFTFTNSDLRHGYSLNSSEPTFLIECHCFKFTLKIDELKLAQHFKDDVDALPSTYDKGDEDNLNKWKNFLEKYGTHVIQSAWAGGDCIAKFKVTQSDVNNHKLMAQIKSIIFNIGRQLKIEDFKNNEQAINTANLIMHGGNPKYHATAFNDFKSEKWLNSIKVKPAVLKTKFDLIPIDIVVGIYKKNIQTQMDKFMKDLFDGELIAIKPTNHEPSPSNREEATSSTEPNGTCLRSGTLILMANGTKIAIEYLNSGDMVVGKNGMPCKVLGKNEVLLGNRYLYGFSSEKMAFFTSEHLFATQNGAWMCIDPDLSRLINPQNNAKQIHRMQDHCKILRWNGNTTDLVMVKVFKSLEKFLPTMKVHCLSVEDNIFIANDYITHDSMPDLFAWPAVSICLASLMFVESMRRFLECFPTIESLKDAEYIRDLSYKISTEWKWLIKTQFFCVNLDNDKRNIKLSTEKFKNLICGDQSFLQEILNRPAFTFLAQNLFVLCGKDLHEAFDKLYRDNNDEFYCRAAALFKTADSLISLHLKGFF